MDISKLGVTAGSVPHIIFNVVLAFLLAWVIALIYKRTHRAVSYSQSFVFTLIMVSVVVTVAMMVVGKSIAAAFGMLGVLSIIRFRTPVKDTRDTAFILFALASGLAVGTNNYAVAIVGTALILLIVWILFKTNFGSMRAYNYLLTCIIGNEQNGTMTVETIFKKYLKSSLLLNINSKQDGKASEMTYQVSFIDELKASDFVKELSGLQGVQRVHLITSQDDVEY